MGEVGDGAAFRPLLLIESVKKLRHIGARRQRNVDAGCSSAVVIVGGEPFAHLPGREAHYSVGVGVVGRRPVKDIHANGSLFQQVGFARQRGLHHVLQQRRVAFAVAELRTGQDLVQLVENRFAVLQRLWVPRFPI